MTIESALLRAITKREDYDKVCHYVNSDAIDDHTRAVCSIMDKYWQMCDPTTEMASMDTVRSMFFSANPSIEEATRAVYEELFSRMCQPLTKHEQAVIINNLIEQELAVQVANAISKYEQGEEIDLIELVFALGEEARDKMTLVTESNFATLDSLKERNHSAIAYLWPLNCLAAAFKPMTGAIQTIVAGLSDIGKTSFALNIAAAWAIQSGGKPILWMNNEGDKNAVLKRSYTIMLGVTEDVIDQWLEDGTLYAKMHEKYGTETPLRVYDIHKMDGRQVEELIKKVHSTVGVGGVFFDMIDNIDIYVKNKQSRTDQVLEAKYQWSRALGVELDYPTVAMSQQSESNDYQQWPNKSMLKDSKVGKQGASDNIMFVTQPEDDTIQDERYISAPKNKTASRGSQRLRAAVKFSRDTGTFYD